MQRQPARLQYQSFFTCVDTEGPGQHLSVNYTHFLHEILNSRHRNLQSLRNGPDKLQDRLALHQASVSSCPSFRFQAKKFDIDRVPKRLETSIVCETPTDASATSVLQASAHRTT